MGGTLNYTDFRNYFREKYGLTHNESKEICDMVLETIKECLILNDAIDIQGFGRMESKFYQASRRKHPVTKIMYDVPAKHKLKFTAYKPFKDQWEDSKSE